MSGTDTRYRTVLTTGKSSTSRCVWHEGKGVNDVLENDMATLLTEEVKGLGERDPVTIFPGRRPIMLDQFHLS